MHGVGKFLRAILSLFRMLAHWQVTLIVLGALLAVGVLIGVFDSIRKRSRVGEVPAEHPEPRSPGAS